MARVGRVVIAPIDVPIDVLIDSGRS